MKRAYIAVWLSLSLIIMIAPQGRADQSGSSDKPIKGEQAQEKEQPSVSNNSSQSSSKLDSHAERIKAKVRKIGVAGRITIVLKNGNERYGSVEQIGDESFQVAEIDLKQQFTINYYDVKKVRSGYGNFNKFTGKRWSTTWHKIALVAGLGLILIPILLAPRT